MGFDILQRFEDVDPIESDVSRKISWVLAPLVVDLRRRIVLATGSSGRIFFGPAHDLLGEGCCKFVGDVLRRDVLASIQDEDERRTPPAQM